MFLTTEVVPQIFPNLNYYTFSSTCVLGILPAKPCCFQYVVSLTDGYLGNCKVKEVDTWWGHWLGGVGVQRHGLTLICRLTLP